MRESELAVAELIGRVIAFTEQITYKPGYRLISGLDNYGVYLQVEAHRPDTETGELGLGYGGKAYVTPETTAEAMVRIALGLFLRYEEHECREAFHYQGVRLFGPHVGIKALMSVADERD